MVIDFVLHAIYLFMNWTIGQLPVATLPADVSTSIGFFFSQIDAWSKLFPVVTMIAVFGVVIITETIVQGFHFTQWIVRTIRGG